VPPGEIVFVRATAVASQGWWTPSEELLERIVPDQTRVKVRAVEIREDGAGDVWAGGPIWLDVKTRTDTGVAGVITGSQLDRDGYREGEQLTVPLDRVLDLVFVDGEGDEMFNEERARSMLGKRIIVGVTLLSPAGELVERQQLVGIVATVDARSIALTLDDGTTNHMPPDCSGIEEARPGDYRLRDAGQVVVDPDFTCAWTMQPEDADPDWMERLRALLPANQPRESESEPS
jgi:hypothetical protein